MATIALLGATGATGKIILAQLEARHHNVIAVYRDAQRIPESNTHGHHHVHWFKGDVTKAKTIDPLVEAADVIISVIGSTDQHHPKLASDRLIIRAMRKYRNKRYLKLANAVMGTLGEDDIVDKASQDMITQAQQAMPQASDDEHQSVDYVRSQDVDWTIVRALFLNDDPAETYEVTSLGTTQKQTPRTSLAQFIADEIDNEEHIRRSPLITD